MDGNASYPLVVLPPERGALVPGTGEQDASQDPPLEITLRWWFHPLWLLFLAVLLIHRLLLQVTELRMEANYRRTQHQRAMQREAVLRDEVRRLQGEIRELERRLYGRKTETAAANRPQPKTQAPANDPKRRRGQQPGSHGHGRQQQDQLPTSHESCTLAPDECSCPTCGLPYEEIPGSADGDILEIEVRAHRRRYHRLRYRRACICPGQPALLTAPPPDKLIAKSNIGISLWVLILTRKFEFFLPLYRILAELRSHGLHLPQGTITGGLKKLEALFQPLYELLVEHNCQAEHWHCDETRWLVFVKRTNAAGFAWSLWVFAAKESVVFVLDPTRSHTVPQDHFGDAQGIMNVDRYSAYKAMAQVKDGQIRLAFCWAHVRRDFLAVLTVWRDLTDWAWSWVEEIATLYRLNDQRLALPKDTAAYAEADRLLRAEVEQMQQRRDGELAQPQLRQPQRKVLTSLQNHWPGLTLFVEHPEVPMDNNEAERRERGPVVARKNFYGSGTLWSGRLAAMLFSQFQTLQVWGMDVAKWLTAYLAACAKAGGKPPPDLHRYLPWNMTPQERERFHAAKPNHAKPHIPPAA
jgi:transposase